MDKKDNILLCILLGTVHPVHPFEIGSRGYISPSNKANLKKLHKFCNPSVNFKAMYENLSSLAVLSS